MPILSHLHQLFDVQTCYAYSNSRSALTFLYDPCRKALSKRISYPRSRV